MDIKTLLGSAYKEGMTLDDVNAALANLPKTVDKTVFDKTASELAAAKAKIKEMETANMTAEQKAKVEADKVVKLQSDLAKELSKLKAKEIFVTAGLTEADFGEILAGVVSEDEASTTAFATGMVKLITAQRAATEKAVKAELLKSTPKPPAGAGAGAEEHSKQIETALQRGDMALVAALIRQQAESQKI